MAVQSKLESLLASTIEFDVSEKPMEVWDKGVFMNELLRAGIAFVPGETDLSKGGAPLVASQPLKYGTYKGTQMALTEIYRQMEESAVSRFDSMAIEPILPVKRDLTDKRDVYQWSTDINPLDPYPPHLQDLPVDEKPNEKQGDSTKVGWLFNPVQAAYVKQLVLAFDFLIPKDIADKQAPYKGPTLADCEKYNRENKSPNTDVMGGENIGFFDDWYSDARFAQQHLSGTDPTTISKATAQQIDPFAQEADKQGLADMKKRLTESKNLYIQDYSYFRAALNLKADDELKSIIAETEKDTAVGAKPDAQVSTGTFSMRYTCAPICIFELNTDGRLHPLAITIDYKGSFDKSVTIFNRRLNPDDTGPTAEKDDWPWRYAKTCVQSADWARHEIAVHLVDTHMIEEAVIVATNRTIPEGHIIYDILSPHWFRTLALNAGARTLLVPGVVARLAGFGPSNDPKTSRALTFIQHAYKKFDFQGKYIPNDLRNRGFPTGDELFENDQYRNYPYAKNMYMLWFVIRTFVASVLGAQFKSDADIQKDPYIKDWCQEIQTKGQIATFPTITTVDQLVDAITMCIHIAAPQHTAINYLQDYYYSWVPNKPPSLCAPLPADLKSLQAMTEIKLTQALPIGERANKWKDWLLAAQMPELLSYKVAGKYNLLTYAMSLYNVNKDRTTGENQGFDFAAIKQAAAVFYDQLLKLDKVFIQHSDEQTKGTVVYNVMQPEVTAVSILI